MAIMWTQVEKMFPSLSLDLLHDKHNKNGKVHRDLYFCEFDTSVRKQF
jgi:hypothetical protein